MLSQKVPVVLFQSLTVEQVQAAIQAGETECISYLQYYENVKRIFGYIELLINLCGDDQRHRADVAKQCLRIIALKPTLDKINLLINKHNENKSDRDPDIGPVYFVTLKLLKKNGAEALNIVKLILDHIKKLEAIKPSDLAPLLNTLLGIEIENTEAYKLIFNTLAEHAKTHPQLALSKFVAEANDAGIYTSYLELLKIFITKSQSDKEFDKDVVIRLFHYVDGAKQKVFYHQLKSAHADLRVECDKQLARALFDKINYYPLLPEENYLLAHKEKMTAYIFDMPTDERHKILVTIFENREAPLSKYYFTARMFRAPAVTRGELKKLATCYDTRPAINVVHYSESLAGQQQQANSLFSPKRRTLATSGGSAVKLSEEERILNNSL